MQFENPDLQQSLNQKIEKWKADLADLGKRNPLIKFKLDGSRTIEIVQQEPSALLRRLKEEKKILDFHISNNEQVLLTDKINNLKLITRQKGQEQLKRPAQSRLS